MLDVKRFTHPPSPQPKNCPICGRSVHKALSAVSVENRTCRCGRLWNARAEKRIRLRMCERKIPLTYDEANAAAGDIRMDLRGVPRPYECPFGNHYHIGTKAPQ